MPEKSETIGRMEFFSGLDRKLLRKVEESAIVCRFAKGETIIREGEMGLGMYVILNGRVEVTKGRTGTGVRLAELGPEQFFAEMSLIDDKPRSASITTLDETECLLLTRDSFGKLMEKNPQISIRLARILAERLRQADERNQAAPPPPAPVAVAATANGTATNGTAASQRDTTPAELSGKAAVQQRLLGAFERLYTVKAFTRFSVAVLGCPVEGAASNLIEEIRVGEVKALIVPADESVEMHIEAYGAGSFNLHVFTPEQAGPVRFGPVAIEPEDRFVLRLPEMALGRP